MTTTATDQSEEIFIDQQWSSYGRQEHEVWSILYQRRMRALRTDASVAWLEGAEAIGLQADRVPDLGKMNRRLEAMTGWRAVGVTGFIPAQRFFELLAERRFPTTIRVRPRQQLDYLPEPDIFHDVFGHVPLHSNPLFADFLQLFGATAARVRNEEDSRRMTRLFWFTVEFGLIREDGGNRIYGSGLISSAGDSENALRGVCELRPFDLREVLRQEFRIDEFQPVLFVLESYEQLFEAVRETALMIE